MTANKKTKIILSVSAFLILLLAAYLPFATKNGYLQDDWDTLFISQQRGAGSLVDHYSIDRPLRGYFSLLEYRLFHTDRMKFQLAALAIRLADTIALFLILMLIWPKRWWINALICMLVLVYPGFHEQPNAYEYQAHLFSRLCMLVSIYFSLLTLKTKRIWLLLIGIPAGLVLAQVSYALMEYYVGIEFLRLALLAALYFKQKIAISKKKWIVFSSVFFVNMTIFMVWRLFIFKERRASVNASSMFSDYQNFIPKILENLKDLAINVYRMCVSAFYQPIRVFTRHIPLNNILIGIALALLTAIIAFLLLRKIKQSSGDEENVKRHWDFILVGLIGSFGALLPIIFGGRAIDYSLLGDRFSYPGSISAMILIAGLLSLISWPLATQSIGILLVGIGVFNQFSNDYIFKLNYEATNQTWWQMAWRTPQLQPTTLLTGFIEYGMNDEDYTFWGPANMIYYPGDKDLQVTGEVLNETTLRLFEKGVQDIYTRRTITYDRNFVNALVMIKNSDACLHIIDGEHPEFSSGDQDLLRQAGLFSDLERIDANSSYSPQPRTDLFGPEPVQGWCYFYEKAQLERQKRNWQAAADLGDRAIQAGLAANDPMEWLVFLQAFTYENDANAETAKQAVLADAYASSQVCAVFSSYSDELAASPQAKNHNQLLNEMCIEK